MMPGQLLAYRLRCCHVSIRGHLNGDALLLAGSVTKLWQRPECLYD